MDIYNNLQLLRNLLKKSVVQRPNYKWMDSHHGIFFFSESKDSKQWKMVVAPIGGIFRKIRFYRQIYGYSDSLYLQLVITTKSLDMTKELKNKILNEVKYIQNSSKKTEYKIITKKNKLKKIINTLLPKIVDNWQVLLIFNINHYKMIRNDNLISKLYLGTNDLNNSVSDFLKIENIVEDHETESDTDSETESD